MYTTLNVEFAIGWLCPLKGTENVSDATSNEISLNNENTYFGQNRHEKNPFKSPTSVLSCAFLEYFPCPSHSK